MDRSEPKYDLVINALSARTGGGLTYVSSVIDGLSNVLWESARAIVLAAPWNYAALMRHQGQQIDVRLIDVSGLIGRVLYEQIVLPRRFPAAVIYSPGNMISFRAAQRSILVVQNIMYFDGDYPTTLGWLAKPRFAIERWICRSSIRKSRVVISVSRTLKESISSQVDNMTGDLELVYSGLPLLPDGKRPHLEFSPSEGFGLVISPDLPHKRIEDAIAGWVLANEDCRHLVVAGQVGEAAKADYLSALPSHLRSRCHFLGRVDARSEIAWLLDNARFLLSTSAVESFGLPSLEAGTVGCPVILSDIDAHREVAGANARFFDVGDIGSIALHISSSASAKRDVWIWPQTWETHARILSDIVKKVTEYQRTS